MTFDHVFNLDEEICSLYGACSFAKQDGQWNPANIQEQISRCLINYDKKERTSFYNKMNSIFNPNKQFPTLPICLYALGYDKINSILLQYCKDNMTGLRYIDWFAGLYKADIRIEFNE